MSGVDSSAAGAWPWVALLLLGVLHGLNPGMGWLFAVALAALGLRQLRCHRHPRFGGMRMGARDLAAWSFLVATAHGAGLMAAPFALRTQVHGGHARAAHPAAHLAGVASVDGPTLVLTAGAVALL